jgi:hypothetical protein
MPTKLAGLIAAVLLSAVAFTSAASVVVETTAESRFTLGVDNQGWWSGTLSNRDNNDNYATGRLFRDITRSFFTFDLSDIPLSQVVVGAELRIIEAGYISADASETVGFFDVSTAPATLNFNNGANSSIYDDLGTGILYGAFSVSAHPLDLSQRLSFVLNSSALTDINAARGGFFSTGSVLLTLFGLDAIFTGSGGDAAGLPTTQLVLTTASE